MVLRRRVEEVYNEGGKDTEFSCVFDRVCVRMFQTKLIYSIHSYSPQLQINESPYTIIPEVYIWRHHPHLAMLLSIPTSPADLS